MTPQLVPYLSVDIIFPKVAHYLAPAIQHNECSRWTVDAVMQECVAGRMLLFVDDMLDPKNALTCQFQTWGGERVLYVSFMGGEGGANWREAFTHIRAFANRLGVKRICADLREGWHRHLKARRLVTLCEIEE